MVTPRSPGAHGKKATNLGEKKKKDERQLQCWEFYQRLLSKSWGKKGEQEADKQYTERTRNDQGNQKKQLEKSGKAGKTQKCLEKKSLRRGPNLG